MYWAVYFLYLILYLPLQNVEEGIYTVRFSTIKDPEEIKKTVETVEMLIYWLACLQILILIWI